MHQSSNSALPADGQSSEVIGAAQVLKISSVCSLTGLSKSSLYRLSAKGLFPLPIKTGVRASAWRFSDIQAWLADRPSGVRLTA